MCGVLFLATEVMVRYLSDIPLLGAQAHFFQSDKNQETYGLAKNQKRHCLWH